MISWIPALATLRALLAIVWIFAAQQRRTDLFALIGSSCGSCLKHRRAATSHGGLVILAWLLAEWPTRLRAAASIIGLTYEELLEAGLLANEEGELRSAVNTVLEPHWRLAL